MKISELERYLGEYSGNAEIFVELEDGYLHDFVPEHRNEVFDGFDEVYPEGLTLKISD